MTKESLLKEFAKETKSDVWNIKFSKLSDWLANKLIAQQQGQTLPLDSVSGWRFIANQEPLRENELYTVLDKFGNVHENIIWGNSGFMNEPWKFFDNDKVKAIDIIAYR